MVIRCLVPWLALTLLISACAGSDRPDASSAEETVTDVDDDAAAVPDDSSPDAADAVDGVETPEPAAEVDSPEHVTGGALVVMRNVVIDGFALEGDDPPVQCLVDGATEAGVAELLPGPSVARFPEPMAPLDPEVALLAADCGIASDMAGQIIAALWAGGVEPSGITAVCLSDLFDDPAIHRSFVRMLTTGIDLPAPPPPVQAGLNDCLDAGAPSGDSANVRTDDGRVDPSLVAAYFETRQIRLSLDELDCIVQGIEDGALDEADLSRQVYLPDPSCIEASTIAASLNDAFPGDPIVDDDGAACMIDQFRIGRGLEASLARCFAADDFAELLNRVDQGDRPMEPAEAQCLIDELLADASSGEAMETCFG